MLVSSGTEIPCNRRPRRRYLGTGDFGQPWWSFEAEDQADPLQSCGATFQEGFSSAGEASSGEPPRLRPDSPIDLRKRVRQPRACGPEWTFARAGAVILFLVVCVAVIAGQPRRTPAAGPFSGGRISWRIAPETARAQLRPDVSEYALAEPRQLAARGREHRWAVRQSGLGVRLHVGRILQGRSNWEP